MLMLPKLNPVRDEKWKKFLHTQPCIITGVCSHEYETVDPAHIGTLGKGMKRGDNEMLPVLHRFHLAGHGAGEVSMFRRELPDDVLRDALRAFAREMYRSWKFPR